MNIYDRTGTLIEDLKFDDDSFRSISLMGDHYCELHFHRSSYKDYPVGCYIDFDGERYTLNNPAQLTKNNSWDIEYTLRMEAASHKAQHIMMRNPVDRRLAFDLTATPREHLQMVVDNLNRVYNIVSGAFSIDTERTDVWRIGSVIDSAEKLVQYNYTSCWSALAAIADAFNTEFHISGKVISLQRVEFNKSTPLSMSYGKGRGFLSGIGRANENSTPAMEYLYAQGSDRNIDPSLYGYKTLRLPKSQRIGYDGEHFEYETGYSSANAKQYFTDNDGMCVAEVGATHVTNCEASLDCTEIYPSREGTVTHVGTNNNIVYIRDTNIPSALNYNDCMIAGENLVITFQSGQLAGKEFDCSYTHSITSAMGLNVNVREFKIVSQEIDGVEMPGTGWMPAVGDKYIITNCQLPESYVCDNASKTGASWDMFRKCVMYMFDHAHPEYSYTGDVDQIWARANWSNVKQYFKIGQHIGFTDQQFQQSQMLLRVVGVKQYINTIYRIELTIANFVKKSDFMQEFRRISANSSQVSPITLKRAEWAARRASSIGLLLNGGNNRLEQAMRNHGGVIGAINNMSQNGAIVRITQDQWAEITTPDTNSIYIVSDSNGKITSVYVGSQGIVDLNGFTYTFPFVLADGGNVLPQGFPLILT